MYVRDVVHVDLTFSDQSQHYRLNLFDFSRTKWYKSIGNYIKCYNGQKVYMYITS